jgi:hypothetical protein
MEFSKKLATPEANEGPHSTARASHLSNLLCVSVVTSFLLAMLVPRADDGSAQGLASARHTS